MDKKTFTLRIILIMSFTAAFILAAIFFALISVSIYDMAKARETSETFTGIADYFKREVRKSDGNVVRTASLGGTVPALVIENYQEGQYYETWYFMEDDCLQKAVVRKGSEVSAAATEPLLALKTAKFSMPSDDLLRISLTSPEKETYVVNIHIPNYPGGA